MMHPVTLTPKLQRDFDEEDRRLRFEQSKIGAWLILFLIPGGIIVDLTSYPQHVAELASYRIMAIICVLGVIALHWTEFGERYPQILINLWLGTGCMMVAYMVYAIDGSRSTYYESLVIVPLAIGILLPLQVRDVVVFSAIILATYVIACVLHETTPFDQPRFINNVFFLLLASVIGVTAVYFNARRRLNEFVLKRELEQRNLQLAELDRVKSEFFANVSHELRTPLTLILAPVQDLQRRIEARSTALREPLRIIEQSALRLLRLVNDLLDLIRFEQGEVKLERLPVNLSRLVSSLVEQVGHLAKTQQLQLISEMPPDPVVVDGDAAALERVIINLLSNAIKFTDKGGRIRISIEPRGDQACVSVADTGIGIDEESIDRIFDRFQQAESSSSRRRQGLGLGLALVKDLVRRMGGDVTVASRRGEGTTFTVFLPLSASSQEPIELSGEPVDAITAFHRQAVLEGSWGHVAPERSGAPEPATLGYARPTLLIVDDEPEMQRYLKAMLDADYNVYQAGDGEAGLAAAVELKPDVVLLDLMLPKIDGLAVCATLKRREAIEGMKIVMLTARVDDEAKLRALENGADDFLTKPFSSVEIKTRLRNLIEAGKLERDLKARNTDLEQVLRRLRETEAQLLHSEKLNSLGTMAAGLLHEINNPINFANTAFSLVMRNPALEADADLKEMLVDIHDGFRRIQTIVSDLRLFSAPTKAESRKPFHMATAVQHALRFTASERSGIEIRTALPEVDMVVGNESQIVQVLVNLLLNAARAIRRQSVERVGSIAVSAHIAGERLVVQVRDNGCGIAPDKVTRIFDPFYTTGEVGTGTGLGLSISHSIIGSHGGALTVKSEEGEWAELSFDLPLEARMPKKDKFDAIASHG
jgi:signal transduction histidine kinase